MSEYLMNGGYKFEIDGAGLSVTRDGKPVMALPMLPKAEGESFKAGEWAKAGEEHYRMAVDGLGGVNLAVRDGYVCYWVDTQTKHFAKLTYFPDSRPTNTGWHTFVSDELDRYWNLDEIGDVPVASAYMEHGGHPDGMDGAGMTDPGDRAMLWIWNTPPRAAAIETPDGWLGLSVPGPISVGITRFKMSRGVFNLSFEELRPTAKEWGPPRVYLVPGLADPYDTLDHHRIISKACGLMRSQRDEYPGWWANPIFKCADEVWRLNEKKWVLHDDAGNYTTYLTTENWTRWIDRVEKYSGVEGKFNLMIDQLFYHGYGDRQVLSTLGGTEGFRRTIDQFRERGLRVGVYIHPYFLDPAYSDFPSKHPEAICKPKDPSVKQHHGAPIGGSQEMANVDWTHPLGRQYMLDYVEWLLGDKPGCLNADWLLINNTIGPDPRHFDFHDPDWGIGDLMTMKSTKLIYEHAKKIKPDCYVRRQSPGDPYMQPYCDQAALCEEWNGQTTAWYRRAHIATRVLENVILHTDAWFVTLTKLAEYYFGLSAVCQPEIESVDHAIHPYLLWREMRPKDYKRIKAGVQTYLHAPIRPEDQCRVNWKGFDEQPEIWRKHSAGPLAGWYAAIAPHKRCLITYGENEARLTSSQERLVTVPLPPGSTLKAVEAVPHEGDPYEYPYEKVSSPNGAAVRLWVLDSAEEVMYIRLVYSLK